MIELLAALLADPYASRGLAYILAITEQNPGERWKVKKDCANMIEDLFHSEKDFHRVISALEAVNTQSQSISTILKISEEIPLLGTLDVNFSELAHLKLLEIDLSGRHEIERTIGRTGIDAYGDLGKLVQNQKTSFITVHLKRFVLCHEYVHQTTTATTTTTTTTEARKPRSKVIRTTQPTSNNIHCILQLHQLVKSTASWRY